MEQSDPLPLHDALVGAQLGEYQVLEPIGEGGMGVVYRGVHPVIGKRVAIKVLRPSVADDAHQVRRLITEAQAVNAIGHRGIVDIFAQGAVPDGRVYIVMELLEGESMEQLLERDQALPVVEGVELLLEICAPLAAAHRAGVIHRDLKPSNVFLCRQADGAQYVKLLDFGLAKRVLGNGSSAQTHTAVVSGTPDYMSPEQARALPVTVRSDVYSLGVMAFELFTGTPPFHGETPMDVMMAHVTRPFPDVRLAAPHLPEQLAALITRMTSRDPHDRPASAEEVRVALEGILGQLVHRRPSSMSGVPRVGTPARGAMRASPVPSSPVTPTPVPVVPPRPRWQLPAVAAALVAVPVVLVLARGESDLPSAAHQGAARPPAVASSAEARPAPAEAPSGPTAEESTAAPATPPSAALARPPPDLVAATPEGQAPSRPTVDAAVPESPSSVRPRPAKAVSRPVRKRPPPEPSPAAATTASEAPPVPSRAQLLQRIVRLEERARRTPDVAPEALVFLTRYRIVAEGAATDSERVQVAGRLDVWERSYLGQP